jgi:hypothetical protein
MPEPTVFQRRLATVAQQEHGKYSLMRELEPPLATQIKRYWNDLGFKFKDVGVAWSAVFVSWCVKTAGATKQQFRFATMHSEFVYRAINDVGDPQAVFVGREVQKYAPKVGDILQNNRDPKKKVDYGFARSNLHYSSHSAIVCEVGVDMKGRYLRTIGGNESDSVGLKEARLDANGVVKNANGLYIAVVETLL